MSTQNLPDEEKELALVNKVEMRIALADTDSKLESLLKLYLAPLLLKLASPHDSVRKKVISICQHVNLRIKSLSIKLPVDALVKQFKDPDVGGKFPLIRNFDLMYIQQGIGRLKTEEQIGLLPLLTSSISKYSEYHLPPLFHIIVEILVQYKPPGRGTAEDAALRSLFFGDCEDDILLLLKWFAKLMLLNFQTFGADDNKTCRGLLPAEYAFLTLNKKESWQPPGQPIGAKLKDAKYSVLKFISSGAFTDRERFLPSLIASAHSMNEESTVVSFAEEIFKRAASSVDLNDGTNADLVENLYHYFFFGEGTNFPPVRWTFRGKILNLLSRSSIAISSKFAHRIPMVAEMGLVPYNPARDIQDNGSMADAERDRKKLRSEAFAFLNKVATGSNQETLETYGPGVIEKLRYYIEGEGQLAGSGRRLGILGEDSRGLAFDTIGLLGRRLLKVVLHEPEVGILSFLFSSLKAPDIPPEVRSSVEGALSSLLIGFNSEELELTEEITNGLAQYLVKVVEEVEGDFEANAHVTRVKYQITRFANRALPFYNIQARWICLVTASEVTPEAAEEAKRGLDPYWFKSINPVPPVRASADTMAIDRLDLLPKKRDKYALPAFPELVRFISSRHPNIAGRKKTLNNIPVEVYSTTMDFCKRVLVTAALNLNFAGEYGKSHGEPEMDVDFFSTKLDASMRADDSVREAVAKSLNDYAFGSEKATIECFLNLIFSGMVSGISRCTEIWVELCDFVPQGLLSVWAGNTKHVKGLIKVVMDAASTTTDLEMQNLMIKALISLLCHSDCDSQILSDVIGVFLDTSAANGEYRNYGAIVGVASILSRLKLRGMLQSSISSDVVRRGIQKILDAVVEPITYRVPVSVEAGLQAIIELSTFGVLGHDHLTTEPEVIIKTLSNLSSQQQKEKAILALACFSLVFSDAHPNLSIYNEKIETALYKTHESRLVDLYFAGGEALCIFACGWGSKSLTRRYLFEPPSDVLERRRNGSLLKSLLDKLLNEWCKNTKPSLKKAASVWLLSMVEFCGDLEQVKLRLREIQDAFRGLLVDKDEFVQEIALRGLTMVYDQGDKYMKDELVKKLVASFARDSKETPLAADVDSGVLATYRDIMGLALEVGEPSLVYHFISLARPNSLWTAKASFGRFGLGSLSSSAAVSRSLKENPKLLASLYSRKFDPNPNVRKVINDIWVALVKDSQSILDNYFEQILQDFLKRIFDRDWRVREATCAAMGDLLGGREVARYGGYLEEIWHAAFRVMDDMKESVRLAAFSLCRVLATSLVQVVSVAEGASQKVAETVLRSLMPFLMGVNGLESQVKEVQIFALDTVVKLVKAAGRTLKDYLPDLIETMLGLLSTTEPSFINYLRLNARNYNIAEEEIDSARLSGVRGSPIMDTVERSLDFTDPETMAKIVPRLVKAIKKAVGLPSKVGCSRLIVTMIMRQSLTEQHADVLLKAIHSAMLDRNDTVAKSYATSASYLCRVASNERVLALINYAKELYYIHEEDRERAFGGEIFHLISKNASEKFNFFATEILPLCFVAMNDTNELVRESFQQTWKDTTGGAGTIRVYLKEIVYLSSDHLSSQRWAVKQGSAIALAEAAKSLKDITSDQLGILWPAVVNAVSGKSWNGKEKVLDAFAELVANNAVNLIKQDAKRLSEVTKIMLREAKRNNAAYRSHAIGSLGKFVDAYPDIDLYEQVEEIVSTVLEEHGQPGEGEDAMDVDGSDGHMSDRMKRISFLNCIATLSQAFRLPKETKAANASLSKILQIIERNFPRSAAAAPYEAKIARVNAVVILLDRIASGNESRIESQYVYIDIERIEKMWEILSESAKDRGNESLREKAVNGIMKVVTLLKQGSRRGSEGYKRLWEEKVKAGVESLTAEERSWMVKKVLEEVVEAGAGL